MEILSTSIPSTGGAWQRFAWGGLMDPGDTFAPVAIGDKPATVTVYLGDVPTDARLRLQISADGKRGWRDLEGGRAAFFKRKPGDTHEWTGLTGFLRPVVDTKHFGPIDIAVTIAPQQAYRLNGAVA